MISDEQLMVTNWLDNEDYETTEYALVNYKNYGFYADMVKNKSGMVIYVPSDITTENIDDHIENIFAILKDGIETDYIHNCKITVRWENTQCNIHIIDYWLSLMMWEMILKTNHPIRPKHIFLGSKVSNLVELNGKYFPWEVSKKDIRNYINKFVLTLDNKIQIGNVKLNEIIAHSMWRYSYIEHFYMYLANTVNNEDDIELMRASPEFDACLHASLYGVPIEQVKDEGMKIANKAIEIIKDSERYLGYEHGLTNSFRASEGINPRQFKEASINIGTKPNGKGGIFTSIIDKNFKTGGVICAA